mgnify:CR=1 FL=1
MFADNNYYSQYTKAANSLIKNMRQLDKVMELLEEGEEKEEYTEAEAEADTEAKTEEDANNIRYIRRLSYETLAI